MTRLAFSSTILLLCASSQVALAERVTLQPSRDATLFQSDTGSLASGSGPALFVGNNSQMSTRRALLAFDVAAAVPAGAVIETAELRLYLSNAPDTVSSRTVTLHRVLAGWGEGASSSSGGGGAPAVAGDATWIHRFYPDSPWAAPGGDFVPAVSASQIVSGPGSYAWTGAGMAADVQLWLDQPGLDFGWLLRGEEGLASTARRFDSRESSVEANRPVLVVDFSSPVDVTPSTWGRVKALFVKE